ncbi:MAG TPA: hypothetical protein VM597_05610 [Gemmataceae bacterium]|jgi:hypothetical protein|nr:hypothetical protein [Gemmataceae bacterium]
MSDPNDQVVWAGDGRADYADDLAEGAAVRHQVWAPAVALMIVGGIGIVGGLVGIGVGLGVLLDLTPVRISDSSMMAGLLSVFSAVAVAWGAVIVLGARRMTRCRNRDLATTAALFSILAGAMYVVSPVVVPIGIWAMYVLTRPEVKAEFNRVRQSVRASHE